MRMVIATLTGSFGYLVDGNRRYYGPGEDILVPVGLAEALGLPYKEEEGEVITGSEETVLIEAPGIEIELPDFDPEIERTAGTLISEDPETQLPDDFPGREHLEAAGYTTLEEVSGLNQARLIAIKGIGKATAQAIQEALDAPDA